MTDFETFWQAYPRRNKTPAISGKKQARRKAEELVLRGEATWEELIEGAKQYAQCDNVREGYVCLVMTWLNAGRWADEYVTAESAAATAKIAAFETPPGNRSLDEWRLACGDPDDPVSYDRILRYHKDWLKYMPPEIKREYGFIKVAGE